MSDRIDQEGRAAFAQTLPRKVTELRATLGTVVADPKSQRMRDELRRRLHALYTLTRSYSLPTVSEGLREGIAHLDAVRTASILTSRDLETLADLIATLPALAQRDFPDQPTLFQPRRAEPPPSSSAAPDRPKSIPPVPKLLSKRPTNMGLPSVQPSAPRAVVASDPSPGARPAPSPNSVPVGVLVVGHAGVFQEVKRVLPPEGDVVHARTLAEAVTAARDTAPDVIVAECAAPGDGLGLLASLRGDPLTDFLPVILLAAPSDAIDATTARAQGATELLTMPLDPEQLRVAIQNAVQGATQNSLPPPSFGDLTLEELTRALQEEIRRGILGAAGPRANNARIALGQGSDVLAATWEAIARVREVVEKRTRGKVRFEMPGASFGLAGAHVLSIGAEEETPIEDEGGSDDPLPARRALVVDDDPGVVWFFAGLLREAGMEVTECTAGAEALRDARRVRPDVVISDILMPGIDGFALCRAIRRDVSLRHIPVILLSWKEDLLVRMRELGAQAQGFLRKESRGEAILARVRAVLRPRIRMLRRLENLADTSELRGRVERVGVFTLLETSARSLHDATLTIADSYSVTELEVREQRLVSVTRTLQDGTLVRGESALLQVLGASNARFAVRRAVHAVRSNVQGDLAKLLGGAAALITALEDSLSGAALLEVASIDLDADAAKAYARSLPEAMRAFVDRVVAGESPRNLILRDGVAPQEMEPVLVELARRGAIRGVRGADGQDLVAPRYAAGAFGDSLRPDERVSARPGVDSGTMPAVLEVPPSAPVPAVVEEKPTVPEAKPEPELFAMAAKTSSWRPPTTVDEASQPGFGLEADKDSLANAVLRELRSPIEPEKPSDPANEDDDGPEITEATPPPPAHSGPPALPVRHHDDDTPELEEHEDSEADLSLDELAIAAKSAPGLPLAGVKLDARGLPRRTSSAPDLPEISGAEFEPHAPVLPDDRPSSSIIVDDSVHGAPPETASVAKPRTSRPAKTEPPPRRLSETRGEPQSTGAGVLIALVAAVLLLGVASYAIVRYLVARSDRAAIDADAGTHAEETAEPDAGPPPVTDTVAHAQTPPTALVASDAAATPDASSANDPNAAAPAETEDPAPFLHGTTLEEGRGLLVIDAPDRPDGEITVDQRPLAHGAHDVQLAAGVHTVRYRNSAVVVFRFVPVTAGRASRIRFSGEQ